MSERMKRLHINNSIEVTIHGEPNMKFLLPRKSAQELCVTLRPFKISENGDDDTVPASEVFKDLYQKYGEVGATIRGCRARDGMTQAALAKKLGIHQSHVSQMEHSKRVIGKKMAQKLAQIFNTSYKMFL